ncbi:cobalt-precorrin-5B (C(1))-methyltransferase [Candidatus Thiosymbion oneisti]|uniref:cobalt-precorrin-5B (C(1))-methyltransferase n=1 Tax=Candidatus Thiosymbion oneisti TaxID=589554 RepID=UPI000B0D57CF|nr:cobalt-precorrin-5B (C(1))-methyltransferase [Candidatus Thiosymbion oneisti]
MAEQKKRKGTRTGFTTGACAAAAARAATLGLVGDRVPARVDCELPRGQAVRFAVTEGRCDGSCAHAVVVKDAGDDPDRTHGARLTADVRLLPAAPGRLLIEGGPGVGTVTMPGLGLAVGGPAINPVPRRNIADNVRAVAGSLLVRQGLAVRISVPGGEKIAQRTLNPRLGILGGISILGTSGIVYPYSTASFRATVVQGIRVAAAQGQGIVVLTTGRRTEKFALRELAHLAPVCFVQMGDFLSAALDTVVAVGIGEVVIGGMVGKLTKMAQGASMTHAGRGAVDMDLLADLAAEIGAPFQVCTEIRRARTARYAAERMRDLSMLMDFHRALAERVVHDLTGRYPDRFRLQVLVCDPDGNRIAEATSDSCAH